MKHLISSFSFSLLFALAIQSARGAERVDITIVPDPLGFPKAVPVYVTGFSGEIDHVLRFDLSFMGFEIVDNKSAARYVIQKNGAGVGAQVIDPLANKIPYNKVFGGGVSTPRQQTHALADDLSLTFLRQPGIAQTRIAFVVQPAGYGPGEIYVSDYDGFAASPVTRDGAICHAPSWHGRNQLLYQSFKLGHGDILIHNTDSGARRQFAHYPGLNASPSVSPDGRHVAMILSKSGSPDLWVANIDGSNPRQLTTTKEDESSPCWSPDSSKICFVSRQTGKPALYTISANGGQMSRLSSSAPSPTEPDWSPDGKYLIFTAQSSSGFQICLLPLEGPARGRTETLVAGEDPVWAPNSRAVLFVRSVNHRHVLALLDVPSRRFKDIALMNGSTSEPSWAR